MSGIHMGLLASKPPGPAYVASNTATAVGATTVVVNKPAGLVSGMLLVAAMVTGVAAGARTWTGDAGWTEQIDQAALPNMRVATLIAGGAEPASYTFTISGAATTLIALVMAFERSTFDAIGALGTSTASANCIAPSVNCSLPGLILGIFGDDAAPGAFSAPAGMTLLTNGPSIYTFSQFSNEGATGTRTSTPPNAGNNAGVLLSLI